VREAGGRFRRGPSMLHHQLDTWSNHEAAIALAEKGEDRSEDYETASGPTLLWLKGAPRSFRKPRAAISADTARRLICPPLGRLRLRVVVLGGLRSVGFWP
jgi:hypothetical protein